MYKICLVEDEENLNQLIKSYLERANYEVVNFTSGEEAFDYIGRDLVHLWILDIMLGDSISGYDLIKKIREKSPDVPVIFTSARDQDLDKIIGLELGSDDYITKPYSPKELVLRVHNIIKRVYSKSVEKIEYEGYTIDTDKRLVFQGEQEISLTTLEFDLLMMFLNNKKKSFSRDDILKCVWGDDYFGSDRVVDDLVRRLRKKMPDLNIHTIYGDLGFTVFMSCDPLQSIILFQGPHGIRSKYFQTFNKRGLLPWPDGNLICRAFWIFRFGKRCRTSWRS